VQRQWANHKGIALAEESEQNPFGQSTANLLVIGAAGGQWADSPPRFKKP